MKTRLKPFLAGFAVFTLLIIQFTPVIAFASINPWEGNPWEGKEFEGNPWEGNTWEGNTFEKDSFEKDSFQKDPNNNTNPNNPVDPNNPNNPLDPNNPNNPSNPGNVDPNNPQGPSNNTDPSNPENNSSTDPSSTDESPGKDESVKKKKDESETWDNIKWVGQVFTDQFAFASKMLEDQAARDLIIAEGGEAVDTTASNLKSFGLGTALLFAKNLSKDTILETPFDMAYDAKDISNNIAPAAKAMKDSWSMISNSKLGEFFTSRGVFNPTPPSVTPPVPGIVSKLNVGLAAVGTLTSGYDVYQSYKEGKTVDMVGNIGSTLMNAGVVAAAIPGVQAAAPFIIAGGAVLYGGAMVVKHGKTIAKAAKKTYEFAKDTVKSVGDGVKNIAKGIGSLFG
ncbi:hypothetical protein [Fictibacillus sp. 18YEL24]|uniref:hypothetical protein n=1 Tax=Fictibacillus sp. 18YEL24 TaxID=2745875 RepID=UPI001E2FB93C|nr:hypothetical protein [Fictibacillus sp. 18YEL24]